MKVKKLDKTGKQKARAEREKFLKKKKKELKEKAEYLSIVKEINPLIEAKLKFAELNREKLGAKFGLHESTISLIIHGKRFNIRVVRFLKNLPPKGWKVEIERAGVA